MSVGAGDLIECRFNNPDVGTGTFFFKSGEDSSLDRGGFRASDPLAMSGDGQAIITKNRMPWEVEGTLVWYRNTTMTLEQLVALVESNNDTTFTYFWVNGAIDTAVGTIVGDIKGSHQDATIPIKMSGGGKVTPVN